MKEMEGGVTEVTNSNIGRRPKKGGVILTRRRIRGRVFVSNERQTQRSRERKQQKGD